LSTIRNADRIFVLEEGRIVESGSFGDLMEKNGRFHQLHDMQFQV
jgi:ABC-type multidrug transport system fused ATPase/permease subunit